MRDSSGLATYVKLLFRCANANLRQIYWNISRIFSLVLLEISKKMLTLLFCLHSLASLSDTLRLNQKQATYMADLHVSLPRQSELID